MHVVEVGLRGMDIGAVMTRMRTWLDHHQAAPVFFESAVLPGREVYFLLQFRSASDASAFAKAFDGSVLRVSDEAAA